jgi:DNA-binding Lrp family transcriptional regulator
MPFASFNPSIHRVGHINAMARIVSELRNGVPMSIGELSQKLDIDRRTVGRVIDVLTTEKIGRRFLVAFKERGSAIRESLKLATQVVRRNSQFGLWSFLKRKE